MKSLTEFLQELRVRIDADTPDGIWVLEQIEEHLGGPKGIARLDELIKVSSELNDASRTHPSQTLLDKTYREKIRDKHTIAGIDYVRARWSSIGKRARK